MGWITSDDGLPTDPALINADTLGGIAADEYATISNIPTDLANLNQDSTHRLVTDSEKQTWNNKSDFDGDYNNLINKPSIPTIPKTVHARIRLMDINGIYIGGLNTNYDNSITYWDVTFEVRENGDLYLPYDVTLYITQPGNAFGFRELHIEFPEDDPHEFDPVSGSGIHVNIIVWTSNGSFNLVQEQYLPRSAGSVVYLNNLNGHRITMVRGWWGRLADV